MPEGLYAGTIIDNTLPALIRLAMKLGERCTLKLQFFWFIHSLMNMIDSQAMQSACHKNISRYPWFIAFSGLLFWFPVFFLYFSSKVSIDQVLMLEAIYYTCVVLLEVPSGYLSDLLGRRVTLIASSLSALCSYLVFFIADDFFLLMIAQSLLAAHISFKSGTDSSLLFESLVMCRRESEIGDELARAQRFGLFATAIAALLGGIIGGYHLALPYALSAMAAVAALVLSLKFIEPSKPEDSIARPVTDQFMEIAQYLKKPQLVWLFLFGIVIFILVHVPYEYFQPYIKLLFISSSDYDQSPLVAGVLICVTMLLGSYASSYSIGLKRRFGTGTALLLIIVIAFAIICIMASISHVLVLAVLMLRSVPMALSTPIIQSVLHENITDRIRASFLSVLSLISRLSFALTLLITALIMGELQTLAFSQLQLILLGYIALAMIFIPVFWLYRKKVH